MEGFTIAHDLEDAINTLSKEYVPYSAQDIGVCGGKLLTQNGIVCKVDASCY